MSDVTLAHLEHDARICRALADHAMLPRLRNAELRKLIRLEAMIAQRRSGRDSE